LSKRVWLMETVQSGEALLASWVFEHIGWLGPVVGLKHGGLPVVDSPSWVASVRQHVEFMTLNAEVTAIERGVSRRTGRSCSRRWEESKTEAATIDQSRKKLAVDRDPWSQG
jgi:hypothetical protein